MIENLRSLTLEVTPAPAGTPSAAASVEVHPLLRLVRLCFGGDSTIPTDLFDLQAQLEAASRDVLQHAEVWVC